MHIPNVVDTSIGSEMHLMWSDSSVCGMITTGEEERHEARRVLNITIFRTRQTLSQRNDASFYAFSRVLKPLKS
jgi:hypothetical protein